jgi:hypothetical protein
MVAVFMLAAVLVVLIGVIVVSVDEKFPRFADLSTSRGPTLSIQQ